MPRSPALASPATDPVWKRPPRPRTCVRSGASGPTRRVITLIAPASASEPKVAERGPRTISIRSMSTSASVVGSKEPPRALVGSFSRMPSTSTTTWFGSRPRSESCARPPRPPSRVSCRPGTKRSASSTEVLIVVSSIAASSTLVAFGTSASGRGARAAVTTRTSTGLVAAASPAGVSAPATPVHVIARHAQAVARTLAPIDAARSGPGPGSRRGFRSA